MSNEFALRRLEQALDRFIDEYEAEKAERFSKFPKFDTERVFALWDIVFSQGDFSSRKERRLLSEQIGSGNFYERLNKAADGLFPDYNEIYQLHQKAVNPHLAFFFAHDQGHIHTDLNMSFWVPLAEIVDAGDVMKRRGDEVREFLELYNHDPEMVYGSLVQPYKMLHLMATSELETKPRTETFQPDKLAWQAGMILKNRFLQAEYSLDDRLNDSDRNQIVVDAEPFAINGNTGALFSIIYNLLKNAYKKSEGKPNNNEKIFVQIYDVPFDSYVITVGDNGTPVEVDKMKDKVRRDIFEKGIDDVFIPNRGTRKRFHDWMKSEYRVGDLKVGDLTALAFIARMSGFDNQDGMSSGMGLYGVKYLLENLGGRILYGEDFATGGPLFTAVLPKDMPGGKIGKTISSLKTGINAARLYHGGVRKAA